jgi:site-specific DNA recombinase
MAATATSEPAPAAVAALYCRISQDRAGDALGVDRQRQDCEALAERRGWTVGEVFVDDDRSAYSGRVRPGYNRMLEGLKAGRFGALVAWHPDRLHRSPLELESFIDLVNATGVAIATCSAGEYDLATAAGRMTARVVGAVARHESEQKSERIRRQREQAAQAGSPHGGGRRAFGYDPTGANVVESEAIVIREAASRFLARESLRTIARDLNERGIPSASGREWTIISLRTMLAGPRLAGLRVFRGEVVGAGTWPAILTREEHDRIVATLGNPRIRRRGRPPTSLLGGLLVCGRCGGKLHHSRRTSGERRYACAVSPGNRGCGGLAIQAERTEQRVTEAILYRIDSPAMRRALTRPRKNTTAVDPTVIESELETLAAASGRGEITVREYLAARGPLEERLRRARESLEAEQGMAALAPLLGAKTDVRAVWENLQRDGRRARAVIDALIDRITIAPANGRSAFDPKRIEILWGV